MTAAQGRGAVRVRREAEGAILPAAGRKRDPPTKMQKPLPVDESVKHFVTPVDFEVTVFVTEKKLGGKPHRDGVGRAGAAVSVSVDRRLPQRRCNRQGEGRDKIVMCEDTDGDGACDKVTRVRGQAEHRDERATRTPAG